MAFYVIPMDVKPLTDGMTEANKCLSWARATVLRKRHEAVGTPVEIYEVKAVYASPASVGVKK